MTFCEECTVFSFETEQIDSSCCCGFLCAEEVCNFGSITKYIYFNNDVKIFCMNREVFLYLSYLEFLTLHIFLKKLDGPFFYFSIIYHKILISLDNLKLFNFVMSDKASEYLMGEVEE